MRGQKIHLRHESRDGARGDGSAAEHGARLRILLPTGMFGPMVLPKHGDEGFMSALKRMLRGEKGRHDQAPNDSTSMAHIEDVAALFLAAYESPTAEGRYYALRESWHWNDIYRTLRQIEPSLHIPPLYEGEQAEPIGFDFTRRDSLGVKMRDIPRCWLMRWPGPNLADRSYFTISKPARLQPLYPKLPNRTRARLWPGASSPSTGSSTTSTLTPMSVRTAMH